MKSIYIQVCSSLWILCFIVSCSSRPQKVQENVVVFLVDAPHFDYSGSSVLIKNLVKHPETWSKEGYVGHAWLYAEGHIDGEEIQIEGGHSGELGQIQAKYFDGIMNYHDYGYANPTIEEKLDKRFEANPIKYLWAVQKDGFFQEGPGTHQPTYAAKVIVSEDQLKLVRDFIAHHYYFSHYQLTGNQCSSFIAQVAALLAIELKHEVEVPVAPNLRIGKHSLRLWEDPQYALLRFSSPDILEKSLKALVNKGDAEESIQWYRKKKGMKSIHPFIRLHRALRAVILLPKHLQRLHLSSFTGT